MPFLKKDAPARDTDVFAQGSTPQVQAKAALRGMSFADQSERLAPDQVQRVAQSGTEGARSSLPHLDQIQRSFGRHDVTGVGSQVGGKAAEAGAKMGAAAYASGDKVAFAKSPSLHTAAHEAAHIVQQRQGIHLPGGVGQEGDHHEKMADKVADAVVSGQSAEALLGRPGASSGSAVQRAPVQMFRDQKVSVEAKGQKKGEHGFVSHDVLPSIAPDSKDGLQYKTTKSDTADVLVSDDGSLAINGDGQVQEFYAKAGMTEDWNKSLSGNKTAVRLAEQSARIDVGGQKLVQVRPTLDGKLLENFAQQECFAVANIVLGKGEGAKDFQAVFQEEGEEEKTSVMNSGLKNQVASFVNDESSDLDDPSKSIESQPNEYVGKEYGKKLGKGKLSDRLKGLGLNEHAKADVGETFVTYSARGDNATTTRGRTDYSKRKKRKGVSLLKNVSRKLFAKYATKSAPVLRKKSWEMHYAGIVAKSRDGADKVSLEDYNRADELADLKAPLLEKLKEQYESELGNINPNDSVTQVLTNLELKVSKLEYGEAMQKAQKLISASGKGSWFMKMYGSKKGQTFHDQSVASGDFVNPLTMRLRKLPEAKKDSSGNEETQAN